MAVSRPVVVAASGGVVILGLLVTGWRLWAPVLGKSGEPAQMAHVNCPKCGHDERLSWDAFFRKYARNASFVETAKFSGWTVPCEKCQQTALVTKEPAR